MNEIQRLQQLAGLEITPVVEAEGDNCKKCNGKGKIDHHSEDGPSKCPDCGGKGKQKWKPEPVNWGKSEVKEDEETGDDVEKTVIGHEDNEKEMLMKQIYQMGKYSVELYKMLGNLPEDADFPHWWQSKIVKASDYVGAAKHYLENELEAPGTEVTPSADLEANDPSGVS
jgi:hypothetical protein